MAGRDGDECLKKPEFNCVFLGLSITSTWGNGHATTYRGLLKELSRRGHAVTFLERDVPWYAANREFDELPYCNIGLYSTLDELKQRFARLIREADVVVVGSYVPEGIAVGRWVTSIATNATAFYDIDTPVTLANLKKGTCEYLSQDLCRKIQPLSVVHRRSNASLYRAETRVALRSRALLLRGSCDLLSGSPANQVGYRLSRHLCGGSADRPRPHAAECRQARRRRRISP